MHRSTGFAALRGLWLAAAVVGGIWAASVSAGEHKVTVAIHVNTQGLDLRQAADGRTLYGRLQHAAWIACTDGHRADLVPTDDPQRCYEKSLGAAVRSINTGTVTQAYLADHSLEQALARGIYVPAPTAAR